MTVEVHGSASRFLLATENSVPRRPAGKRAPLGFDQSFWWLSSRASRSASGDDEGSTRSDFAWVGPSASVHICVGSALDDRAQILNGSPFFGKDSRTGVSACRGCASVRARATDYSCLRPPSTCNAGRQVASNINYGIALNPSPLLRDSIQKRAPCSNSAFRNASPWQGEAVAHSSSPKRGALFSAHGARLKILARVAALGGGCFYSCALGL